jgi:Flp pilus assembly protein CpaB
LKRSNRLVLLIGVFLAVVAFVAIVFLLGQDGPPDGNGQATPVTQLNTVIATRDIPLGLRVTADMVTVQELPVGERKDGALQNPGQVVGQIARKPIANGAHVTAADFISGRGIVDIEVPPGMLGIAVQVDQVTGVGTVIKTGDYVDMVVGITGDAFPVVTLDPEDESITVVAGLNSTSVKLLIEGMQVIGTLLPPPPAQTNNQQQPQPSGQPETTLSEGQQEIVILAVTAQQAEIIKFAQLDGDISLALRSPSDFVDEEGNPIVSIPAGTTGIVLKTLVDGGYGVLRPELVEAIIPAQ